MAFAVFSVALREGTNPRAGGRGHPALVVARLAVARFFFHALMRSYDFPQNLAAWNLPLIGESASPLSDVWNGLSVRSALRLRGEPDVHRGGGHPRAGAPGADRPLAGRRRRCLLRRYLYHVPVLGEWSRYAGVNQIDFFGHPTLVAIGGALALSLPLAFASYRYVELPFLRLKDRRRPRREPAQQSQSPLSSRAPA